ncbi:hypothetical protein [Futiania mangrovi]|uniref:Uncharacterized protein n=1 Tax=Futiania mangrovi TaxID=2959716 RepID=A0A9J6PEJ6_9PROT|nr:hypothetical protein [Futiania mangrovii]MCP1336838.1 hypothetical protein [Futiania mangrovii]
MTAAFPLPSLLREARTGLTRRGGADARAPSDGGPLRDPRPEARPAPAHAARGTPALSAQSSVSASASAPAEARVRDTAAEAAAVLRQRAIEMADALSHELAAARAARLTCERTAEEAVRALVGALVPAAARATAEDVCLEGLKGLMASLGPARLEVQAPAPMVEALRAALAGAPEAADMVFTEVSGDAPVRVLWQDGAAVFDPVAAAEALTAHLTRVAKDPEGH